MENRFFAVEITSSSPPEQDRKKQEREAQGQARPLLGFGHVDVEIERWVRTRMRELLVGVTIESAGKNLYIIDTSNIIDTNTHKYTKLIQTHTRTPSPGGVRTGSCAFLVSIMWVVSI